MISVILPYWDRQGAAEEALRSMAKAYPDLEIEVVVVDDGNPVPFVVPDLPLAIRVVRRPLKHEQRSCIAAWNEGVRQARGDIICLSCAEVVHQRPVLAQMAAELENQGPMGYVLAAAWCPDFRQWHCHSSVPVPTCPPGTGLSFCSMLRRSLYDLVGGFDEAYMAGVGYEDRDFIQRMHRAGARFLIRDDLVVIHPKTGATIAWPSEWFETNRILYESRWPC